MFGGTSRHLALLACLADLPAVGTAQAPIPQLVTYGHGEIALPPDRAIVQVAVTIDDSTAARAASGNAARFNAVINALAALGFEKDSLVRISYSVGPNYDWQNAHQIKGYRARSVIRLSLRNLSQLGPTIDGALASGATDIPGITFESDTVDAARLRALQRALGQARADAVALATSAGVELGDLLVLSTGYDYESPMRGFALAQERFDPVDFSGSGVEFASRDVVVRVSVTARWRILPRKRS